MKLSKPVLFVLILSVIVSLYLFLSDRPKKVSTKTGSSLPSSVPPVTLPITQKPRTEGAHTSKEFAKWVKDPFLLPENMVKKVAEEKKALEIQKVKLYAIIESKKGRVAIIGDEIVGKGDIIKTGEKVVEIGKESVSLKAGDAKRIIFLEKQ